MNTTNKTVRVNSLGLDGHAVFLAHKNGNWGNTNVRSDCLSNQLQMDPHNGHFLFIEGSMLQEGEEFKLIVPWVSEEEAKKIHQKRVNVGVHVGTRFDYDKVNRSLSLLAESHAVIRKDERGQNNVF